MPVRQTHWALVFKTEGGSDDVTYKWYGTAVSAVRRAGDYSAGLERQGINITGFEVRED